MCQENINSATGTLICYFLVEQRGREGGGRRGEREKEVGDEDSDPHKQNCHMVLQYMCQENINSATGTFYTWYTFLHKKVPLFDTLVTLLWSKEFLAWFYREESRTYITKNNL